MLQSIGSTLSVGTGGSAASAGVLEAQLARYEIKLADWCHCPSGKTPEGKQKIAELQAKADAIKAQLQQVEAARSQQKVAATSPPAESRPADGRSALGNSIDVVV